MPGNVQTDKTKKMKKVTKKNDAKDVKKGGQVVQTVNVSTRANKSPDRQPVTNKKPTGLAIATPEKAAKGEKKDVAQKYQDIVKKLVAVPPKYVAPTTPTASAPGPATSSANSLPETSIVLQRVTSIRQKNPGSMPDTGPTMPQGAPEPIPADAHKPVPLSTPEPIPASTPATPEPQPIVDPIIPIDAKLDTTPTEEQVSEDPLHVSTVVHGPFTTKKNVLVEVAGDKEYKVGEQLFKIETKVASGTNTAIFRLKNAKGKEGQTEEVIMKHSSNQYSHYWLSREYHILKHLTNVFGDMDIDKKYKDETAREKDAFLCRYVVRLYGYRNPGDITKEMSLFLEPLTDTLHKYFTEVRQGCPHFHIIRAVIFKCLKAVKFCRRHDVIHTQINPNNFMLSIRNSNQPTINFLKLINFDHAIVSENEIMTMEQQACNYRSLADDYSAPEIILGSPPHNNFETYSIGLIAWWLLTGENVMMGHNMNCQLENMIDLMGPVPANYATKANEQLLKKKKDEIRLRDRCDVCIQNRKQKMRGDPRKKGLPRNWEQLDAFVPVFEFNEATSEHAMSDKPLALQKKDQEHMEACEKQDFNNLKDFLKKCLTWSPTDRMTIDQALDHPFLDYSQLDKYARYTFGAQRVMEEENTAFNECCLNGVRTFDDNDMPGPEVAKRRKAVQKRKEKRELEKLNAEKEQQEKQQIEKQ